MQLYISANTRGNRSWTLGWESSPTPWHLTFPWNLDINHERWEWKEKNLQLSGFKPKWTDSPFFNLGRFHLKAYISILLYINKVRRSGDTRGAFWPQVLLMQLSIFCPINLVLQFSSASIAPWCLAPGRLYSLKLLAWSSEVFKCPSLGLEGKMRKRNCSEDICISAK